MSDTHELVFKGTKFFITVGYDNDGFAKEVFGSSARITSDMDFLVSDACIILSIALQNDVALVELARSLKTVPVLGESDRVEQPASLIGLIVEKVTEAEKLLAADIAMATDGPV